MNFIPYPKIYEQNNSLIVLSSMKKLIFLLIPICVACASESANSNNDSRTDLINELVQDQKAPKCPENHSDSIIPIVYGYPSEELFEKSDSGLVALGRCELADENWFCKIHKISFK